MLRAFLITSLLAFGAFAGQYSYSEQIRVTHSEPIYENVTKRVPQRLCEPQRLPGSYAPGYPGDNDVGLDTVIGAVVGVALGNQVSKGHGRQVAKVLGGIAGAAIANDMRHRPHHDYEQQRCETRYRVVTERVITGYRNVARYHGEKIVKISNRPLRYIVLKHKVYY